MPSKLTWEYGDEDGHSIVIRKKKGMLTMDEIMRFLHERDQLNVFDGDLAVIVFRVNSERDMYPYGWDWNKPEGDAQEVYMIGDEEFCPICGQNKLFPQYCPACGEKIKVPTQGKENQNGR